jgi:hypothetical protein
VPGCPRCKHPAAQAPSVCTECGFAIPAGADPARATALPRGLLLALLTVLVALFLLLVPAYLGEAGRPGR